MTSKLDKSAFTNALLKKFKGKQARSVEVVAPRSLDLSVNAFPITFSSIFKVKSKKRRRSSFSKGGDATQPFTSGGSRSHRPTVERSPFKVSKL